jgi:hypothetical protein
MTLALPRPRLGTVALAGWQALLTVVLLGSMVVGSDYFLLPRAERPDHLLHELLHAGGGVGLWLGVLGTGLMLIMHLYTLRKWFIGATWMGPIDQWLRFHIVCGVMGPAFIVAHAGFQLPTGMIAVGLWCMVLVALSGVFGRYVFGFLPRMSSGRALAWDEALGELVTLRSDLVAATSDSRSHAIGEAVALVEGLDQEADSLVGLVKLQWEVRRRQHRARELLAEAGLPDAVQADAHAVLTSQLRLKRGLEASRVAHRLLRYWHLFHRPLAKAMYAIVVLHVVLALMFGDAVGRMLSVLSL